MRSFEIFAAMPAEEAERVLGTLAEAQPAIFAQALAAAGAAMKARPVYLKRMPFEKRAQAIRRALARVAANPVAGEILAVYFLECRKPLLVEWLDAIGLEHEDGTLQADAPPPPEEALLRKTAEGFLAADDDPDRPLLLAAFSAQEAIEWPLLDALLEERSAAR